MMIHQQLLPLLPHIKITSKNFFERFTAHSMVFRSQKKVQPQKLHLFKFQFFRQFLI